jgi:hypothetical protein
VGQPVFSFVLALGQSQFPVHLLFITPQHSDDVSHDPLVRIVQLTFGSALKGTRGFR